VNTKGKLSSRAKRIKAIQTLEIASGYRPRNDTCMYAYLLRLL